MRQQERVRDSKPASKQNHNQRKPIAKPDARLLAYSILTELPQSESVIITVFRLAIQDGIISTNACNTFVNSNEEEKKGMKIQLQELIVIIQNALDHIGFWGKITIKFVGRELLGLEYSRTTGMDKMYCSLCAHNGENCYECKPALSQAWLDIDVNI